MWEALKNTLAPDVPEVEDFRQHWQRFLEFYSGGGGGGGGSSKAGGNDLPVEKTHQLHHLNAMLKCLANEQEQLLLLSRGSPSGQQQPDPRPAATVSPCLEFMVEQQLLDVLSTVCHADVPAGIRPHVIKFFSKGCLAAAASAATATTSGGTSAALPPHLQLLSCAPVYNPIRRLLALFCSQRASPTESEELAFVVALVTRIRAQPHLLPLFTSSASRSDLDEHVRRKGCGALVDLAALLPVGGSGGGRHLIVSALLIYVDSQDYLASRKAMAALVAVCALDDPEAAEDAVEGTRLCAAIVSKLVDASRRLNLGDLRPGAVEETTVNWLEAHHDLKKFRTEETKTTNGDDDDSGEEASSSSSSSAMAAEEDLVALLAWYDFCDDLISKAHPVIGRAVASAVASGFMGPVFEDESGLMSVMGPDSAKEELPASAAVASKLALLTQLWIHTKSDSLAKTVSDWMMWGSSSTKVEVEVEVDPEQPCSSSSPFMRRLLELCSSGRFPAVVSVEALRLFDTLLERPCLPVLRSLLLTPLEERAYCRGYNSAAESHIGSWSDEEDEREKLDLEAASVRLLQENSGGSNLAASGFCSRTISPNNIGAVMGAWLGLVGCDEDEGLAGRLSGVPANHKDPPTPALRGFEEYIANAEVQTVQFFECCQGFGWPTEAVFFGGSQRRPSSDASAYSSDSKPEVDKRSSRGSGRRKLDNRSFYEGDFLATIFDMVEAMLERSYDVNLQLTSVISKLCALPHPNVHEYLLNPTVPLAPDARSLHGSLKKVLTEAKRRAKGVADLKSKIRSCKKSLLAAPPASGSTSLTFGGQVEQADEEQCRRADDETNLVDSIIILEEFCKELAAIAFVKYNLASPAKSGQC